MEVRRARALAASNVLVVEPNFLLAEDMRSTIQSAGIEVLGPVASAELALRLVEQTRPDAALFDFVLADHKTTMVARRLTELRVPFVVISGHPRHLIPGFLLAAPYVAKPFFRHELVEALTTALDSPAGRRR
jgi:DNA-binding response OmpR family regulator